MGGAARGLGGGASRTLARERELDLHGRARATAGARRCPSFEAGEEIATRDAGKTVMQALKPFTPTMIGGAADLVESTKTEFEGGGVFAASHAGRNIPFGIREHAMGSIVNGIALEPAMLKPYGSTFFVFSDYMRPGRAPLGAHRACRVIWVWTHDSVGLGEDGPTHQPVEHLMALRAIPNLWTCAPATRTRPSIAWRIALERDGGPVALALTPAEAADVRPRAASPTRAKAPLRGGYVLWQRGRAASPTRS